MTCCKPPIAKKHIRALFDHIRKAEIRGWSCDRTLSRARKFLLRRKLPVEPVLTWLEHNGGYCDCEILMNVERRMDDVVG